MMSGKDSHDNGLGTDADMVALESSLLSLSDANDLEACDMQSVCEGRVLDTAFLQEGRIVTADELGTLNEIDHYVLKCREEAERRLADVERLREEAREDGYQQGSREAAELMARITRANRDAKHRMTDDLIEITMKAVRLLIDGYDRADLVAQSVTTALKGRERQRLEMENIRLRLIVHPEQSRDIRRQLENALGREELDSQLVVEVDDGLPKDRCLLTGSNGSVELGIEQQLAALHAGLTGGEHRTTQDIGDTSQHESNDTLSNWDRHEL